MSKFHNTPTSRELRRMKERMQSAEERDANVRAWMAMSPQQRREYVENNEYLKRIERNGITTDDVIQVENDAYKLGLNTGRDSTFRTIFAAICLTLHELHGFNDDQCIEVLNSVYDKACYALTSKELIQEAFDSVGVELSFDGEALDEPARRKED